MLVEGEVDILHSCSIINPGDRVNDEDMRFLTVQVEIVFLHPRFGVSETVGECGVSSVGDGF